MIDASIIQQVIAPAAMIPACGLLLLSSTARMNTLLARVRAFHAERLAVWAADTDPATRAGRVRTLQLEGLEHQTNRLMRRVRLLRYTMLQLLGSVACNLLAVIVLAMRFVIEDPEGALHVASAAIFIAGVAVMLGAMVTSLMEVWRIEETLRYEHQRVERLCASGDVANHVPASVPHPGEGTGL